MVRTGGGLLRAFSLRWSAICVVMAVPEQRPQNLMLASATMADFSGHHHRKDGHEER
jgi:hypothetical protein